ncbi:triple tyrosine motif-containing protein [uncultured Bacteroides sp.]|uniref:helix-turn-helix and ligand-binding sensor domain-containing protein n=1 Tax=uncultured Bacteroides sp. TaxID=162156 RepID=UPI002AA89697|nr:triple tyrosine motif-containing protein [uncultured Bacteroides sp.]
MKNNLYTSFRLICLLIFFSATTLPAFADWNNFIINYNKNLFGKGSQTWQVASYNNNWVYFANKNGMLQFDGSSWNVFPLNNQSDVRSVHPSTSQKCIYVGGINEFGYFKPGNDGKLVYVCLSDSVPEPDRFIGNVWRIHENDNILYLQGDGKVLKLLNGKYTTIDAQRKIDCSEMVNGILYIGTDKGVWVLVGNTFFPLQGAESLVSKRIRGIIPHKKGVIIVTAYDGLYYCDGRTTVPFITGAESFMKENEIFCAAALGDLIALGTVHKGILVVDKKSLHIKYINENNGLQNNTVLSVAFDGLNNLWAGLDNGIDYICLNSSLTNLYAYPFSFGTGYAALLADHYLYLGTNRGLYYTKYPVELNDKLPDIRPVSQSSGQVWNLCKVGSDLFCLHDRGIFLLKGTSMKEIGHINGAWCCQPVMGTKNKMFVGVYDGLYLLEKVKNEWKVSWKIQGLFDSCRFFEQESPNVLWVFNSDKTLRVELDALLSRVVKIKSYGVEKGFPSDRDVYVSKVSGKICFATPKGIYQYNEKTDRMEHYQEMDNLLNGTTSYSRLVEFDNHLISLSHKDICIANLQTYKRGAGTSIVPIEFPALELVQGAENVTPITDSLIIIPNDYGFALLKVPSSNLKRGDDKSMYVRKVYLSYPKDSLIYMGNFLGKKEVPSIPYSRNAIRIEYGISSFIQGKESGYQYRLNQENWSDFTNSQTKEYSNLPEGEYTFEVRAVFQNGTMSTDRFSFKILPPWYRTGMAYASYFVLFLLVLWYLYRWDDVRVKRKKQQAVVEKDKELQYLEKEYKEKSALKERQIMELEKDKLEYDLQHKSQEMANLMINFVRKNEMLTEIKSDLFKIISILKGDGATKEPKKMLLLVNNKIDSNIQADDVLKRIEEQFDLIHNNFMKHLHEKYPDLSLNERMMCAYLKMNLSSKEIAPLLNISIRGVETIRYRLRKKFSLEREDSLTDYLNTTF